MSLKRDNLRNTRKLQGMTALDLAEAAGLSESQIYNLERGRCRPSRDNAVRVAQALRAAPEHLFPDCFDQSGGAR